MKLDEAIKHYGGVAEKEERSAKLHPRPDKDVKGSGKKYLICLERAEEHRQLTEWLKELEKLREQTEMEKCGDCISRRAIIGKCEDTARATSDIGEMNTGFIMALDFIADYAKHMPSVESERKTGKWIPIRIKSPQNGQRIFISTIKGTIHDVIWNTDCIHNYARNGCWYRNWFVVAWMPFTLKPYKMEVDG